jgi:ribosomal protein S27AE
MDPISKILGDKRDYCPLCGAKVGRGNYDKKHGCGECAYLDEDVVSKNLSKKQLISDGRCPKCGSLAKSNFRMHSGTKIQTVEVWCKNKKCPYYKKYNKHYEGATTNRW